MSKLYMFIINTDSYAGDFEREMCAYATGQTGDCNVGKIEAECFSMDFNKDIINKLGEYIEQVPDEYGCYRPVEVYNNNSNNHREYHALVIYFNKKPTKEMIDIMKSRCIEYGRMHLIKVLSFEMKLKEEIIKYTDIPLE